MLCLAQQKENMRKRSSCFVIFILWSANKKSGKKKLPVCFCQTHFFPVPEVLYGCLKNIELSLSISPFFLPSVTQGQP